MILYDCYGLYRTDSSTKIIYWYTYAVKSIFYWPRPEDAPSYDAPEEEIKNWCKLGDDWEVVYWEKEPLDNEWLQDALLSVLWSIGRVVGKLWFKIRRVLVNKMLEIGEWDEQFIQVPNAGGNMDEEYAIADAVYQYLVNGYGRNGYYVHEGHDLEIEAELQEIYDEWYCKERPKWIEAMVCVDTWRLTSDPVEDLRKIMRIRTEVYQKFHAKETYYLCKIVEYRNLLEH